MVKIKCSLFNKKNHFSGKYKAEASLSTSYCYLDCEHSSVFGPHLHAKKKKNDECNAPTLFCTSGFFIFFLFFGYMAHACTLFFFFFLDIRYFSKISHSV